MFRKRLGITANPSSPVRIRAAPLNPQGPRTPIAHDAARFPQPAARITEASEARQVIRAALVFRETLVSPLRVPRGQNPSPSHNRRPDQRAKRGEPVRAALVGAKVLVTPRGAATPLPSPGATPKSTQPSAHLDPRVPAVVPLWRPLRRLSMFPAGAEPILISEAGPFLMIEAPGRTGPAAHLRTAHPRMAHSERSSRK
jgi:hypothetical protein